MTERWICNACTFENGDMTASECEMCCTKRKVVGTKNKSISTSNGNGNGRKESKQQTLFGKPAEVIDLTTGSSVKPSRKRKEPPKSTGSASGPLQSFLAPSNATGSAPCTCTSTTVGKASSSHPLPIYTRGPPHKFTDQDIQSTLKEVFQLDALRKNLQPQAIDNAIRHQSQLLVLATGGGKSLCYQLPACLLGGVTIVVSPLIALMQDQIQGLLQRGIPAACVSSQQTTKQNQQVLDRVLDTKERPLTLLYITPESIQTDRMRQILQNLHDQKRLTMFAIDEAHCLSSWGHDFRPAYRKLAWLRTQFPNTPCMACTATATPQVIEDIQTILHLKNAPLLQGSFDRPNIFYKVKYKHDAALNEMIQWIAKQHTTKSSTNGTPKEKCSGIVYVHKREDTSFIASRIRQLKIRAEPYHAGLNKADRNRIQEEWSQDQVQVAVATVAFGMGIDLPHVRYVIHWSIPKTLEGFYQESGRAGRDGLPSHSILYYSPDDVAKFKYLIQMQSQNTTEANCARKLQGFEQMVKYCTNAACRRNALIQHFGGSPVPCQHTCDYCRNPEKVKRTIQSAAIVGDVLGTKYKSSRPYQSGPKDSRDQDYLYNDDEDAIAQDWGDGMVGELRVTDPGGSSGDVPSVPKPPKSFKGGFVRASSILDKYEKMEKKAGFSTSNDDTERPSRSVPIPEHFRMAPLPVQKIAKKKPEPTSQQYAENAAQLRQEMEQLDAKCKEQEERLKALLEKRRRKT